eukprot:991081-Prymnesium_polylepis.1
MSTHGSKRWVRVEAWGKEFERGRGGGRTGTWKGGQGRKRCTSGDARSCSTVPVRGGMGQVVVSDLCVPYGHVPHNGAGR